MYIVHYYTVHCCYLYCAWSYFNMYILWHGPCVCVFMYGQATESRWVNISFTKFLLFIERKGGILCTLLIWSLYNNYCFNWTVQYQVPVEQYSPPEQFVILMVSRYTVQPLFTIQFTKPTDTYCNITVLYCITKRLLLSSVP